MAVATGRYIFLLGGLDVGGSTVGTVYRIDTRRGRTKRAGSLAAPTHGGAALLLHRRAYVFGGAGPPIYDLVQEYDPTSGRTRVAGHLPGVRADMAAAAVGRQVVVAAGYDGLRPLDTVLATADERPGGASNAILRFNPATHRVLRAGRLPEHVSDGGVATIGNTTYILGGINGRPLTAVCVVRIG